jgi:hypothetical protein
MRSIKNKKNKKNNNTNYSKICKEMCKNKKYKKSGEVKCRFKNNICSYYHYDGDYATHCNVPEFYKQLKNKSLKKLKKDCTDNYLNRLK